MVTGFKANYFEYVLRNVELLRHWYEGNFRPMYGIGVHIAHCKQLGERCLFAATISAQKVSIWILTG